MYKQVIWGKTQARWREEHHKVPVLCGFFERGRLLSGAGCPQIGQLQAGKETLLLPGYLPLTDEVSLELLKNRR